MLLPLTPNTRPDFKTAARLHATIRVMFRSIPDAYFTEERFYPLTDRAVGFRLGVDGKPEVFVVVPAGHGHMHRLQVRLGTTTVISLLRHDYDWESFVAKHEQFVPGVLDALNFLAGFLHGHTG